MLKRINCTHSKCVRNNTQCFNQSRVMFPTPAGQPGFVWPKCNDCANDSEHEIKMIPLDKNIYVYLCGECLSKVTVVKDEEAEG